MTYPFWRLGCKRKEVTMAKEQAYHVEHYGNKAVRRDYSKVSSDLELPDLIEIQTAAFEWFTKEGIREVFEDIFPIENHNKNTRLNFIDYHFEEPKRSVSECLYRQITPE